MPLASRPSPQIQFVAALGNYYPALTSGDRWDRALTAAENTCRVRDELGEAQLADATAQRFARADQPLDLGDGTRILALLTEHRVCASFGLA
ncbi:hypothetical protein Actkin_05622 [Actinokineospora sp. UTMC 2448]|nr:hypothetical protein Actkin_05622 [Actinokineospora sp. UTMC 2448]